MSFPRYPKYKDSGVEWLGEVPEHWETSRLGFLASRIGSGKTPAGGADNYQDHGVLFVRSQNVHDEGLRLDDVVYISEDTDREMAASRVEPGDILLNITGASLGRTCVVPKEFEPANVNQHVCAIRLREPAAVDYISLLLKSASVKAHLDYIQNGAAREGLNFKMVSGIACPLPPIEERERIASFLGRETAKIDALIAEQQRLIELLQEKRQAVISHVVTKGLKPDAAMRDSSIEWLGEVPRHWHGVPIRWLFRQAKRQNQNDKQVLSVYRDYGVILKDSRDDNLNKTPEDLTNYQLVEVGDLVVNKMKAWQGSLGISPYEGVTSPDYVVFSPIHRENPTFLHHLLRDKNMADVYLAISNGIRPSQWRLEADQFLGLTIFLPPADEQLAIVATLERTDLLFGPLVAESTHAITLLQERRSALISAAVTGQIDVRGLAGSEAA